ncbi:alpha/beta hydrolase [Dietzia alimentaria]|uniref:alpha/beta hydrolase n=1 Tax=Dietzia alimentaria TaxID=665550 RepID=UPI00029B12C3|nr:alpha/beta hydrolase [Dietzia alimentaria]
MALSYTQIKHWRSDDADLLADAMNQRVTALQWVEDDLRRGGDWSASWSGSHGEQAATHAISALGDRVTDLAADATALRRLAAGVADAVHALHQDIIGIEELASKYSFLILGSGEVVDLKPGTTVTREHLYVRRNARTNLEQSVREIIAKGQIVEDDAAAGLTGIVDGRIHDGGAATVDEAVRSQMSVAEPPAAGTDPMRVNMWWESLSDDEKDHVRRERGEQIRNLAGIDTAARNELNRAALAADRGPATAAVADAQAQLEAFDRTHRWDELPSPGAAPGYGHLRAERQSLINALEAAVRERDTLTRLEDKLRSTDSFLIEYNDSTPQLQAVYAVGNPDTAHNVTVTTPGYTTNVYDSFGSMADEARALKETAERIDPDQKTAAVAFIGYQAPQDALPNWDFRVAGTGAAEEGARSLSTTMHGIQATNGGADLNLSLFGHSYGSTTAGIAAQLLNSSGGTPVDNLVLYGSPGVPLHERDPANGSALDLDSMGLDPSRAYFMENPGDPVSGVIGDVGEYTPLGLGERPSSWGMTPLSTESAVVSYPDGEIEQRYDVDGLNHHMRSQNPDHHDVGAHSAFPNAMTTSQYNLAAIAAGRPDLGRR